MFLPDGPPENNHDLAGKDASSGELGDADEPSEATPLRERAPSERTKLVCLLPTRNAAEDLPGYFESAARFCDAIVALDDGSTDDTRQLLEACPLVKIILSNPRREGYRDWDDAANRNRLLAAAAELKPEWIISIDADERLDRSDAGALREFLDRDALPGCAYGFRVFSMQHDLHHYSPEFLWVYRLFAYESGQSFPDEERLHFAPVPTSIPRVAWIGTTLRIQHLGGMTAQRRRARFEKYRQADPENEFQEAYTNLLKEAVTDLPRWKQRPTDLHVLLERVDESETLREIEESAEGPAISVVTISRNDETRIARTVASVVNQKCPEPFEVIVVTSGTDRTAEIVRDKFPEVTLVELPRPALPGEARNAGLRLARGTYVTFPGSHIELLPGSLAARLRAHRLGYSMVAGAAINGTRTWAGWASYFLDGPDGLPGQPAGVMDRPPGGCSYARAPLVQLGGFPEHMRAGEDTAANWALYSRGYVPYREPQAAFVHYSPCRTPRQLVRHHFTRGRGLGRLIVENSVASRLLDRQLLRDRLLGYLPHRLRWTTWGVWHWGKGCRRLYVLAFPLVVVGAMAAWLGMWYQILLSLHRESAGRLYERWSR